MPAMPTVHPIVLTYRMPNGIQEAYMDHPGRRYTGTTRVAYLPHTPKGRRLVRRLQFAFRAGLTFRVGTSLTTHINSRGGVDVSIHHKTSLVGETHAHGYTDADFVDRCMEELDHLLTSP